jgi:hypothetical protein
MRDVRGDAAKAEETTPMKVSEIMTMDVVTAAAFG